MKSLSQGKNRLPASEENGPSHLKGILHVPMGSKQRSVLKLGDSGKRGSLFESMGKVGLRGYFLFVTVPAPSQRSYNRRPTAPWIPQGTFERTSLRKP